MKCDYTNLFIHDYVDGYLSADQAAMVHKHIAHCNDCTSYERDVRKLKTSMMSMPDVPLSHELFYQAMMNAKDKVTEQQAPVAPVVELKRKRQPYMFALAASIVFATISSFLLTSQSPQTSLPLQSHTTNNTTVASADAFPSEQVNLVFNSPSSLENVTFTVSLPNNMEMRGYPGSQQVSWKANLQAGKNLLHLPIIAKDANEGVVLTKLNYGNKSREFEVVVAPIQQRKLTI